MKRTFEASFVPSIWQSDLTKAKGLGAGDIAAWQRNIDTLAEYKTIDKGFKAEDLVMQPGEIKA